LSAAPSDTHSPFAVNHRGIKVALPVAAAIPQAQALQAGVAAAAAVLASEATAETV